jgi:hypothetical protein
MTGLERTSPTATRREHRGHRHIGNLENPRSTDTIGALCLLSYRTPFAITYIQSHPFPQFSPSIQLQASRPLDASY